VTELCPTHGVVTAVPACPFCGAPVIDMPGVSGSLRVIRSVTLPLEDEPPEPEEEAP
jgi:hypothetical protein